MASATYPRTASSGIDTVADSTERDALTGLPDGWPLIQLDTDELYIYDNATTAWKLASVGTFLKKTGDTSTGNIVFSSTKGIDSAAVLNIGVSTADTINIGNASSTVNIAGTTNYNNVTNYNVTDKLLTINDGGSAGSGSASGIEIEEDGSATGYVKTASDRNGWDFLAPNQNGIFKTIHGGQNLSLDFSGFTSSAKTYTAPNFSGVLALTDAALTQNSIPFVNSVGQLDENTNFVWDGTNSRLGIGTSSPSSKLHLSGSFSQTSWTTTGPIFRIENATLTNTSSSGTVAHQTGSTLGIPTFNSSNPVTVTDGSSLYIPGPAAGTGNTTITRPWAIYQPSGRSYFDQLNVGTHTQISTIAIYGARSQTNAAANGLYGQGNSNITIAGSYQSAALTGDMTISGTANNTSSVGGMAVDAISRCSNTATVASLVGIRGLCTNTGVGTVTNMYNIRALPNVNSGGGTVVNAYGITCDDQTVGSTTNTGITLLVSDSTAGSGKYNVYASGSSANYMNGKLSIGVTTASAKLHVISTTEQFRVGYDASNYYNATVSSAGLVTLAATGSSAGFNFSSRVLIPTATPSSATDTGTTGHIAWDSSFIYVCTGTDTWKRVAIASW